MFYHFSKKALIDSVLIGVLLCCTQCTNKLKVNSSELFEPYDTTQISLIKDHWNQYFKDDIFPALDSSEAVFPIAFDSYGAIYPNDTLFQEFVAENFAAGIPGSGDKIKNITTISHSDNDLNKYSMFQIFHWEENALKLEAGIRAMKNKKDQNFYHNLLHEYSSAPGYNEKTMRRTSLEFYRYVDGFYDQWNAYHLNKTNEKLLNKLSNEKPDHILFFIHGYNVPYSLAVMQSIEIRKYIQTLKEEIDRPGKLLLLPVFWSSNDQKKSEIDTEEKVTIRDEVKVSNVVKWGFYSTRANFAGLGLRQILHQLESNTDELPELLIYSHSLGAIVATSALINATSRLPGNYSTLVTSENCGGIAMNDSIKNELEVNDNINYKLLQKFNTIPLPQSHIRLFMSAPAISGVETFTDMCEGRKVTTAFFSTVNNKDLTLKKFVGMVSGFGNTSLGLNYNCDVMQTKIDYFWDQGYFYYNKEAIEIPQHSLFDYLQQPAYRRLVKDFLEFEFPATVSD